MSQTLPNAELKLDYTKNFEEILSKADNAAIGYVLQVDIKHTDKIKKPLNFWFCSGNKNIPISEHTDYMESTKLEITSQQRD